MTSSDSKPQGSAAVSEVFPLLWSNDVAALADWVMLALGLTESWRAPGESGVIEHAELLWPGGKVSINIVDERSATAGPGGIALRCDDRAKVDAVYALARSAAAHVSQPLAESRVAYGFTVIDPDGNQWWVHAENGFLDQFRSTSS